MIINGNQHIKVEGLNRSQIDRVQLQSLDGKNRFSGSQLRGNFTVDSSDLCAFNWMRSRRNVQGKSFSRLGFPDASLFSVSTQLSRPPTFVHSQILAAVNCARPQVRYCIPPCLRLGANLWYFNAGIQKRAAITHAHWGEPAWSISKF